MDENPHWAILGVGMKQSEISEDVLQDKEFYLSSLEINEHGDFYSDLKTLEFEESTGAFVFEDEDGGEVTIGFDYSVDGDDGRLAHEDFHESVEGRGDGVIASEGDAYTVVYDLKEEEEDTEFFVFGVGIEKSHGMSPSDLEGEYYIVEMGMKNEEFFRHLGALDFDGEGTFGLKVIEPEFYELDDRMDYEVDPDGKMKITGFAEGVVSQDGEFFALATTKEEDDDAIWIGIKRADVPDPITDPADDTGNGSGSSGCTVNPGQPLGLEWLILGLIGLGIYMRRRCRA